MAKQQIQQKETVVAGQGGVGQQLERTYTVDDNSLPSPQELAAYKGNRSSNCYVLDGSFR